MSYDSGFGSNGAPFEYSVDVKNSKTKLKKILFLALYVLWVIVIFALGALIKLILPLLAFVPISVWILVWLTWKYTQISYQYSFFKGDFTVYRVYGEKKKTEILKARIKDISSLISKERAVDSTVNDFKPVRTVFAASGDEAENLTLALCTNENGEKVAVYFELNDGARKIMRYYNSELFEDETHCEQK